MSTTDLINYLSVFVLIGFLIALVFLIALLYRANRIVGKLEHLSETFRSFVADIVPAIINVSTIASAVEGILRATHHKNDSGENKKAK